MATILRARKKILHCIPSLRQGGAERLLVEMTSSDPGRDHVVVSLVDEPHDFKVDPQFRFYSLGMKRSGMAALLLPVYLLRWLKVLNKEKPDVVVGCIYSAQFARKLE